MTVPETDLPFRRALAAALLAGLVVSALFVAFNWTQALVTRDLPATGRLLLGILIGGVVSVAWYATFLLAVLLVVGRETNWRTLAGSVALVYVIDLLLAAVQGRSPFVSFQRGVLAVPLPQVGRLIAIAAAYWLAYDGGYERIAAALGHPSHPLFAIVTDDRLTTDLTVGRGVVAASLAALISVSGFVLAGTVQDLLTNASGAVVVFLTVPRVGIPLGRVPMEWLFEASLLLAVLLVTGPETAARDVLKGLAVVFVVGATARLAPALLPPFQHVALWTASGPILAPLADALLVVGIALAVWLALGSGIERVRSRHSENPLPE